MTYVKRFWSKVDKRGSNECWEWKAFITRKGYGHFWYKKGITVMAHRFSWLLHHGKWPEQHINHVCNNRACVNPVHLEDVSFQENIDYMTACNRQIKGSKQRHAKLIESDIPEIRKRLAKGEPQRSIAEDYGVDHVQICYINTGKTWKHVA